METTEVVIVGAGPIGLEVAVGLKQAGVPYIQFDAAQIGATIQWWAPGTRFFSSPERIGIAGVPLITTGQEKATREEYLAHLRQVVQQFDLPVRTFERVISIHPRGEGKGFLLQTRKTGDEQEHRFGASRVVLAIGDMHRPRMMNIPGEHLPHVNHYFGEPHQYFGQRTLIVGGRNSAVEAAIRCHRVGAHVAISHRRADFDEQRVKYWLLPELRGLIKSGAIRHYPLTMPRQIMPGKVVLGPSPLEGGAIWDNAENGGQPFEIDADRVLALTGYEMDTALLESAGVEVVGESRMPQHNPRTMETNIPGLYVAGTASAGTQHRFKVFIENSHIHAQRIVAAITGHKDVDQLAEEPRFDMPES